MLVLAPDDPGGGSVFFRSVLWISTLSTHALWGKIGSDQRRYYMQVFNKFGQYDMISSLVMLCCIHLNCGMHNTNKIYTYLHKRHFVVFFFFKYYFNFNGILLCILSQVESIYTFIAHMHLYALLSRKQIHCSCIHLNKYFFPRTFRDGLTVEKLHKTSREWIK